MSHALPNFRFWWLNFIISATAAIGCAALSWHLIEKPINRRKRDIIAWVFQAAHAVTTRLFKLGRRIADRSRSPPPRAPGVRPAGEESPSV